LQVDETPVKVLEADKKGYMWCYLSPLPGQRLIQFRFHLSRGGDVVNTELEEFSGLLQSDGYAGYTQLREKPRIISFGCLTHARRKFAEIIKIATPKSAGKAHEALSYFAELYRIEGNAKELKLSPDERKKLRQKEADTNGVENQIRPFAGGRRNWLFVGHGESAQIGALFYSLIQSAKLNDINPRVYLHYLLTQVHALRKKEVEPLLLLPHRISLSTLTQFAQNEFDKVKSLVAKINAPLKVLCRGILEGLQCKRF
jgi:transposase